MPYKALLKKRVPKLQNGTGDLLTLEQKTVRAANVLKPMQPLVPNGNNYGLTTTANTTTATPTTKTPGKGAGIAAGIAGSVGSALDVAGDMVTEFSKEAPTNTFGFQAPNAKAMKASSALKTAGKWAGIGASIGSAVPGIGTAIGGAVGLVGGAIAGLFKGKKDAKKAKKTYTDNTEAAYADYSQKAAANQYAAMAMHGAKLSIMKSINSMKDKKVYRRFKTGGKLEQLGAVNVIPSGKLHKENNNLGNKDKGIPIIDGEGKKVFEVEKEELIFRLDATKTIESLVDKYKNSNNDMHAVELGKFLASEIMDNTHDFSGKFNVTTE